MKPQVFPNHRENKLIIPKNKSKCGRQKKSPHPNAKVDQSTFDHDCLSIIHKYVPIE